jgi:IS30 family transposase
MKGGSKMSLYTHFTTTERELSRVLREEGYTYEKIAKIIGKNKSSVCREFKRNSNKDGSYNSKTADKKYRQRRRNCKKQPILKTDIELRTSVIDKLEKGWSPEQIDGRMKFENGNKCIISYHTIYRSIDLGILPKQLRLCLRIKHVKNRQRRSDDKRGKVQDRISIHERPEDVETRKELGHWESDTVLGKRGTGCIGTHVERKTGFLAAFKAPDKKDETFNKETIALFNIMPDVLKKSFTVDNGKEFWSHKELSNETGMIVYFCDPHCPWQRGTNENTNGLLRQYFPKRTSFADITNEKLQEVVDLINYRPRKRLGYRTPAEVLNVLVDFCCT